MAEYKNPSMGTPFGNIGGNLQVMVKMEGRGWVTLDKFLTYLSKKHGQAIKRDFAKVSRDYLKRFKGLLFKGLMSEGSYLGQQWAPHSPNYYTHTNRLLYLNGLYQKAIQNMTIIQKHYNSHMYVTPADTSAVSVKGGLTVGEYARVHESGSISRRIPARPLWGPAFIKIESGKSGGFAKRVGGAIGKRLNKMGVETKLSRI